MLCGAGGAFKLPLRPSAIYINRKVPEGGIVFRYRLFLSMLVFEAKDESFFAGLFYICFAAALSFTGSGPLQNAALHQF